MQRMTWGVSAHREMFSVGVIQSGARQRGVEEPALSEVERDLRFGMVTEPTNRRSFDCASGDKTARGNGFRTQRMGIA
jgi:hypothetical protein